MWLQLVKTFFVGQVALEQAVDAVKKQSEVAREKREELKHKAENRVEDFQHKFDEIKGEKFNVEKVREKFESNFKENVAALRKGVKPFDRACDSLASLLGETAEMKEALVSTDAGAELAAS